MYLFAWRWKFLMSHKRWKKRGVYFNMENISIILVIRFSANMLRLHKLKLGKFQTQISYKFYIKT